MTTGPSPTHVPRTGKTVAEAKAALHAWGEEGDVKVAALRTEVSNKVARVGTKVEKIAAGGGVALIAVLLLRQFAPRRARHAPAASGSTNSRPERSSPGLIATGLRLLTITRVARWVMPHVQAALAAKAQANANNANNSAPGSTAPKSTATSGSDNAPPT